MYEDDASDMVRPVVQTLLAALDMDDNLLIVKLHE